MSNLALQLARRFEPRHVLMALGAIILSFAVLDVIYDRALDSLVAFHLDDSNPAVRNSFPAVVTGAMLACAGALALAVASMRDTINRPRWRAGGIVLILLGIEEALGLHTWAVENLDVSWYLAYLPVLAIAAVAWLGMAELMGGNQGAQRMFVAGIAGWLVAGALDASRTGRSEALAAGELLQMAAAALLLVGLFSFARSRSLAADPALRSPLESNVAIARAAVSRVNMRAVVMGLALFLVLFAILGAIVYPGGGDLRVFDLNKEQTFPATFSGVLLLAASGLALLNGLVRSQTPAGRRWWIVLALVFAFLGLDEIAALHEAVQDRVHVWGQATLIPIVIVGVYAWWITLRQLQSEQPAGMLFLAGAAAWVLSQGIDAVLNEHWGWTIVPEELLEMIGSALFGLALLVALRQVVASRAPATPEDAEAVPARVRQQRVPAHTS